MRWLKRGLWVAVWGCWAWCGFGLARELPRYASIEKSNLELEENEWLCGYLADGVALTCIKGDTDAPIRYRTWDASTGNVFHDWKGPLHPSWELLRLGFVVGVNKESFDSKTEFQPFQILDLRTGTWMPLGSMGLECPEEHPARPWFAIRENVGEVGVFVYDVLAKKRIFEWKGLHGDGDSSQRLGGIWFDDDVLVIDTYIELERRDADGSKYWEVVSQRLEWWHIPKKTLLKSVSIDPPGWIEPPGPSGRMLKQGRCGQRKAVAVLDAHSLRAVFSCDDPDEGDWDWEETSAARIPKLQLSASGRTLLSDLGHLWSVDSNRVLWRRNRSRELVLHREVSPTSFLVRENWTPFFEELHLPFTLTTIGVRDMETGAIQHRVFDPAHHGWAFYIPVNSSTDVDASARRTPLVNYLLLTLCQTILALPLALLWAGLRWRRSRRIRREACT